MNDKCVRASIAHTVVAPEGSSNLIERAGVCILELCNEYSDIEAPSRLRARLFSRIKITIAFYARLFFLKYIAKQVRNKTTQARECVEVKIISSGNADDNISHVQSERVKQKNACDFLSSNCSD